MWNFGYHKLFKLNLFLCVLRIAVVISLFGGLGVEVLRNERAFQERPALRFSISGPCEEKDFR